MSPPRVPVVSSCSAMSLVLLLLRFLFVIIVTAKISIVLLIFTAHGASVAPNTSVLLVVLLIVDSFSIVRCCIILRRLGWALHTDGALTINQAGNVVAESADLPAALLQNVAHGQVGVDAESRSSSAPPPYQPHANPPPYIALWTTVPPQHRMVHGFSADGGESRRYGTYSVGSSISLAVPSTTSDRPGHGEYLQLPVTGPQGGDFGVTSDAGIHRWLADVPPYGYVGPPIEHPGDRHSSDGGTGFSAGSSEEARASTRATSL